MARYIDVEKADLETIHTSHNGYASKADIVDWLNAQPTADVVEVETIKAWLYEIAINNVGVADEFSNACEEFISRLDGLRRFATERRDT